jgi:hypothetical protein
VEHFLNNLTYLSIADTHDELLTFQYRIISTDETQLNLCCDEPIPQEEAPPQKYTLKGVPKKMGRPTERRLCQSKITLLPKKGIFWMKHKHVKYTGKRKWSFVEDNYFEFAL